MEKTTLNTGLKVWLWIIFVINIFVAVADLITVFGAAAVSATLGLGTGYTVLCLLSLILQVVLVVGIAMMLFAQKKLGFYLLCATAVVAFVVNLITYGMLGTLTPVNIVRAIINMILFPLVTYILANDEAGMKAIASVPSREELLSKFLGSIQSPITNFACVLNQIAEKGGAGETAETAPAEEAPAAEATEAPAEEKKLN